MGFYAYYVSGPIYSSYHKSIIRAKVQKITAFSRGLPTVIVNNKEVTLHAPISFGKYLVVGDSIVKLSGTENITVFRTRLDSIEIMHWEYVSPNGYEDVKITRNVIKNK